MQLVAPSIYYKEQYLQALEEGKDETGDTRLNQPEDNQSFEEYVQMLNNRAKGLQFPLGYVPETIFWLVDNNEVIGRVSIRHTLTDHLRKIGGHIGYYIRPSKRKMGYGKKILELALQKAKEIGLSKALVTCDEDNIGSQKIIEANSGVLQDIIEKEKGKPKTRRYWIIIKS
jgi:predicted acetyltransferase